MVANDRDGGKGEAIDWIAEDEFQEWVRPCRGTPVPETAFYVDEDGRMFQRLNPQMVELLKLMRAAFVKKHGREPGAGDRVFPGLDKHDPQDVYRDLRTAGMRPSAARLVALSELFVTESSAGAFYRRHMREQLCRMLVYTIHMLGERRAA